MPTSHPTLLSILIARKTHTFHFCESFSHFNISKDGTWSGIQKFSQSPHGRLIEKPETQRRKKDSAKGKMANVHFSKVQCKIGVQPDTFKNKAKVSYACRVLGRSEPHLRGVWQTPTLLGLLPGGAKPMSTLLRRPTE